METAEAAVDDASVKWRSSHWPLQTLNHYTHRFVQD